jgi:hypothetical protein
MNAVSGACRRWAAKLAQHASFVLPGAQSSWAEAMRRELDYIGDDRTAWRWALGCVLASYKARLASPLPTLPRMRGRVGRGAAVLRHAAASGALMLLIGLALLENAGGQTEPPRPIPEEATCDPAAVSPEIDPTRSGTVSVPREMDHAAQAPDTSCAEQIAPTRLLPKYRTP